MIQVTCFEVNIHSPKRPGVFLEEEKYNLSHFCEKKINIFHKDKILSTKKKKCKHESHGLSFIWGKVRMIAWETGLQIALRNCSLAVGGRSVYMRF